MRSGPNSSLFMAGYNLGMKITLRELFLLTVIVALALGWWLDRSKLKSERNDFEFEAYLACDLAAGIAGILKNDANYSLDFTNGCGVRRHGGASFAGSGIQYERLATRIREKLEQDQ